jgi:hypothetical protein
VNTTCRMLIEESRGCEDDQAALQGAQDRSCLAQLMRSGTVGLADTHYNAAEVRAACDQSERFLVASGRGPYPHTDAGVELRPIFHRLGHVAIENFRASTSRPSSTPTKGRLDTARFALRAVFV